MLGMIAYSKGIISPFCICDIDNIVVFING